MRGPSPALEDPDVNTAYDHQLMARLTSYLKPYLPSFIGSLFCAAAATAAEITRPYLLKRAIDEYITPFVRNTGALSREQAVSGITTLALFFLVVLVAQFLFSYGQTLLLYVAGQNAMKDMRDDIFGSIMHLPVGRLQDHPAGRLVTRATNDVEAVNELYNEVIVSLIKDLMMVLGLLVIMFVIDWQLTLLVLLLAPVTYKIGEEFRKRVRRAYRAVRRNVSRLNSYVAEHLSGMRIIKIFAGEDRSRDRFEGVNDDEYRSRMDQLNIYAVFRPLVHLIRIIAIALVLWAGGFRVVHSTFTIGSLVMFLSFIEKLFKPIQQLSQKYDVLQKAMASAERMFGLIDSDPEPYDGRPLPAPSGTDGGHRIEFRNVWFSYEDEPGDEDWVLRDVSFTVHPGEDVAIVGPTGSGKSTMIKLLLCWRPPQKGKVFLDNVDLRELDLQQLRSTFGVVLQDVQLFAGDVTENIRLWDDSLSDDDVETVLKRVRATSFVNNLPDGPDTNIKQQGEILAEGQRQLLSFARALAHEPDVLLLDEATAHLDSQTEERVLSALRSVFEQRTTLTIAHRLSTIDHCDRIFVLHRGKLIEQGPHDVLMRRDGLYARMYRLQSHEEPPPAEDEKEAGREDGP